VRFYRSQGVLCRVPDGGYGIPEVWFDSDDSWHAYPQLDTMTNATPIEEGEAARMAGSAEALSLPRAEKEEIPLFPEDVPPAAM
jgi:hypothetical protein